MEGGGYFRVVTKVLRSDRGGGYFRVVDRVDRGDRGGGPLLVVRRECGDYHELAFMGVYFIRSNSTGISVLHQSPCTKVENEGRIAVEQMSMTWLTEASGAIQLPPLIFQFPNRPIPAQLWREAKIEAQRRIRAALEEAYAKYGIPNCNQNEVHNIEEDLANLIRAMNLDA